MVELDAGWSPLLGTRVDEVLDRSPRRNAEAE